MVSEWKNKNNDDKWPSIEADTIPKLLKLQGQKFAGKIFMRQKDLGIWERFTWKEVYENVRRFGLGLLKLGLKRGETVAIAGENQKEFFWSEYATLAAGGKVVCLYPDMNPSEIKYILEHSDSVYFVAQDQDQIDKVLEMKNQIPTLRKVIYWESKGMWHYRDPLLMEFKEVQSEGRNYGNKNPKLFEECIDQSKGNDIAILSYSALSETTGSPKGAILTHNNLLDYSYRIIMRCPFKPFTQYLSCAPPAWSMEQVFGVTLGILVPLVLNFPRGSQTVKSNIREIGVEALVWGARRWENLASMVQGYMLDAGVIRRFLYNIGMGIGYKIAEKRTERREIHPIWYLLRPMADRLILRAIRDNLGLKRTFLTISEGGPMTPEAFRFFHAIGVELRNGFGVSEAGLLTLHRGEKFDTKTVGTLYQSHPVFGPPLEMKLGEKDELFVKGGSGFSGYYKNPEASAEKMVDGWIRTGVVGHIREDGEIILLDRVPD